MTAATPIAAAAPIPAACSAVSLEAGLVLIGGLVACIADMPLTVAGFVALEVAECLRAALRHRTMVAMSRIVPVIDVAIEAVRPMEPRTGPDEDPVRKPIRAVVAVRSTVIRRIVEVAVRAYGCYSNADHYLRRRSRKRAGA